MKKSKLIVALSSFAMAAAGFVAVGASKAKKVESVSADSTVRVNIFLSDADTNVWLQAGAKLGIGCTTDVANAYVFDTRDSDFPTTTVQGNTTCWSELSLYNPAGNDGYGWSGTVKGTTAVVNTSYFGTTWDQIRFFRIDPSSGNEWNHKYGGSRAGLLNGSQNTYTIDNSWNEGDCINAELYHKVTIHDGANNASSRSVLVAQTGAYYPTATAIADKTFIGWYTDSGLTHEWVSENWVVGDLNLYAKYRDSIPSGRYAIGTFGGGSWDVEHGYKLPVDPSDDSQLKGQITFEYGDEFQLAWWNDSTSTFDNYFGYDKLMGGAIVYFGPGSNPTDIRCYASGTYYVYAKETGFGDGKYISIELKSDLSAEHLAAKLMSYGPANPGVDGDHSCGSKFSVCKAMYLNDLSPEEQATFRGYESSGVDQFKNAFDRYIAWAAALGEKPFEEGKVSASGFFGLADSESGNLVVIVAIVSVISVSTLAALIVIKKRRAINK